MFKENLGINFNPSAGCFETGCAIAILTPGIFAVAWRCINLNTARIAAQIFKRYAGRHEDMPEPFIHVAAEKHVIKSQPFGQLEDDPAIRAGFAPGLDRRLAQLHQQLTVL